MIRGSGSSLRHAGFSLVELMVSAAILGLLASVAMPLVELTVTRQREHELRLALQEIRQAIDKYKVASASGRIAVKLGKSGYPATLGDLAAGIPEIQPATGLKVYFLRRVPRDPFVADRSIAPADTWSKRSFDSPPNLPKEGDDVFDVYSRSTKTGLNGVPYAEW